MYGGQAGGGKSDGLVACPLRWIHLKHFRGILFRNSYVELERTLVERTRELYEPLGAKWNGSKYAHTFPSGAKIYLAYLDAKEDALSHKSAEYQFAGFDELTSYSRFVYTYILSRMRSSKGIPIRVRSATNPGDKGHEWVFERWRAWLDPEYPNRARPGEVRWFIKLEGQEEEIEVPAGTPKARARCFIPAKLTDTPQLSGTGYENQLDDLDPVTRAQLKLGNWLVKPGRGQYFKRQWCNVVTERPTDIIATVRYWDFAGTEKKAQKHDPDWSAGVKMSLRANGRVLIEHCECYRGEPAVVEANTLQVAQLDTSLVRIGLEQDPGQAGKFQMSHFVRMLFGFTVEAFSPTGSKIQRFSPFSAQAQNGNVDVLAGPWVLDFFNELEQFPEGGHDDRVDATSGAFMMLCGRRSKMQDYLRSQVRTRTS
jgi:predicted phage terminase large subunit-like protein